MDTTTGHTVSDLHLLTNRSSADRMMPRLHEAAAEAGLFVLNGDIFDFRWSKYRRLTPSIQFVERWISELVVRHPACQFVFVMGNHDSMPPYGELLTRLSQQYDNLAWEPYYLKLGSKVFLHGDVRESPSAETLAVYRTRWHKPPHRRHFPHLAYYVFNWSRLPRLLQALVPTRRLTSAVVKYLKVELGPDFETISDVYCGHTHRPVTDYRWDGLRFHNTGATIHGIRHLIQTFTYDPADLDQALQKPGVSAVAK